jgi:ATP-dependent Lhr-like helicase
MLSPLTVGQPGEAKTRGSRLPKNFRDWFAARGWQPRAHQLALVDHAAQGQSVLLVAPTGGGKTLAGFLPSLIDLADRPKRSRKRGLHTLYISPLKALAVDVARNLDAPIAEMELPVTVETRTGDTSAARRQRQRHTPPDILLTTPEQLSLLLAHPRSAQMFESLRTVVLDELHALYNSKRGDLLALGLARLAGLAPGHRRVGLSATVKDPVPLQRFLVPQPLDGEAGGVGESGSRPTNMSEIVIAAGGAKPQIEISTSDSYVPWAGHLARHAMIDVMAAIQTAKTALVFVNTRSQAERTFQELWAINDNNLPIALHHGSLAVEQRRKVEAAMAKGNLRAVVCTSTLDLGIDWGAVDKVICIGAPKGAARLVQRIGRANHRLDEPSAALLVPANRFEVLECNAARDAVLAGELDGERLKAGALDVLAQHVLGTACAGPFDADALFAEVRGAASYAHVTRKDFDAVVDFVATGGYALRSYDRYARLRRTEDGRWRLAHPRLAQEYRLNAGVIVEDPMVEVRLQSKGKPAGAGGRKLGELEESFIEQLSPGDTFVFAGDVLRFEGLRETGAFVTRTDDPEAEIPSYNGGKFPLSTFLAQRVREMVSSPESWGQLPEPVQEWLKIQEWRSMVPKPGQLLIETFPRGSRHYLVCYPFEGRLAHQTLGMLVTRRLERQGLHPMGFIANEYALAVWAARDLASTRDGGKVDMDTLFDQDMLGDDLDAWLADSNLYKRTFRQCAIIAGLIQRRFPGKEKSGRQVTFSSDLIYDVLRSHEPDHVLLRATYQDAGTGLLDIARLGDMLARVRKRIVTRALDRVSPLAVPALLEISREMVAGGADEAILRENEDALVRDAMRVD